MYLHLSYNDLDEILSYVFKQEVEKVLNEVFGPNYKNLREYMTPFQILMKLIKEREERWQLIYQLFKWLLRKFAVEPELLIAIIKKVVKKITGKVIEISVKAIRTIIKRILIILAAIETLADAIAKTCAPKEELKHVSIFSSTPTSGEFSSVFIGDPEVSVVFYGDVSASLMNKTRVYNIEELYLQASTIDTSNASFRLRVMPHANYTAIFISFLSDPDARSVILGLFGICTNKTLFTVEDEYLVVEGNGTCTAVYKEASLHIANGRIQGQFTQPFTATIIDGTWLVNLSMVYPFGKSLWHNVSISLPDKFYALNVSTPNYILAGNTIYWTSRPDSIVFSFKVDDIPPNVAILSPEEQSYERGTTTVHVDAYDGETGIEKVEFYLNETLVFTDYDYPYEYMWNTTEYPDGTYMIKIIAYDGVGNVAGHEVIVIVDNTAPSIGGPTINPESPTEEDNVSVKVSVTDALSGVEEVILGYSTDGGATWSNMTMTLGPDGYYMATIPRQPAGTTVLYKIYALDIAGNQAVSPEYSYMVRAKPILIPGYGALIFTTVCLIIIIALVVLWRRRGRESTVMGNRTKPTIRIAD